MTLSVRLTESTEVFRPQIEALGSIVNIVVSEDGIALSCEKGAGQVII